MRLFIRRVCASEPGTAQLRKRGYAESHLFKKGEAGVSNIGGAPYRANCLSEPREPFKRDTADLAQRAIAGAGGVFSQ